MKLMDEMTKKSEKPQAQIQPKVQKKEDSK
jgi:hypothetical protein